MKHTRRNFLKSAGLMAASAMPVIAGMSAMTSSAFAATLADNSDFNFVLFRVQGGMDSVLGLHPWLEPNSGLSEEDLWLDYDPRIEALKNIDGTQISLGPSARSIAQYAKNMAIIRGVCMGASDLGHPRAIQHISAGRDSDTAPHMMAYIGAKLSDPTRFVVTNTAIQRGTVESFPVILTQALKRLGDVSQLSSSSMLDLYNNNDLAVNRYLNLLKQKNKLVKFNEVLNSQNTTGEIADETVGLAALAAGLSRVVQIDLIDQSQDLDTHAGHANHKSFQAQRWERIAKFLKGLQNNQLMEKTLVAVVTEFNRSPGKNTNQGKDHNYSDNAVALFGRNIQSGKVVGDHKLFPRAQNRPYAYWGGSYLNYKTGQTVTDIDPILKMQTADKKTVLPGDTNLIYPSNVWATISNSLGVSAIPEASIIPGVFKR